MTTVSVNAYDDADLLDECLASVRDHLPDARIQVVDGRYETWPADHDVSADATPAVADRYDAEYHADAAPFPRERHKHRHRGDLAPDGERVLFIDADERLLSFDPDATPGAVSRVRIFNALMYGSDVRYYPRYFYPTDLEAIPRVDRFSFDAPVRRTDDITIVHRADLRGDAYRDAKLDRFDDEDRDPWYKDYLDDLDDCGFDAEFHDCPECGRGSVTRSRVTGYGDGSRCSYVEACTAGDSCHRRVVPYDVGEFRYVPDRVGEGFAEDVGRVRVELMVAGYDPARIVGDGPFERYEPTAKKWCRDEFDAATLP